LFIQPEEKQMATQNHRISTGFIMALNRRSAIIISMIVARRKEKPAAPQQASIDFESYLAIPTFIRQGKTLGYDGL